MTTNKTYFGNYPATILSYNPSARTVQLNIPTVTDGITDGITGKIAYAVGDDDKDTEILILNNPDCYVFFERGDPASPVVFGFRSHGAGAVVDYRRIRQKNIELLATANVKIEASEVIEVTSKTLVFSAENVIFKVGKITNEGDFENQGQSNLVGTTTIEGKPYSSHGHTNVENGSGTSGGVAQ